MAPTTWPLAPGQGARVSSRPTQKVSAFHGCQLQLPPTQSRLFVAREREKTCTIIKAGPQRKAALDQAHLAGVCGSDVLFAGCADCPVQVRNGVRVGGKFLRSCFVFRICSSSFNVYPVESRCDRPPNSMRIGRGCARNPRIQEIGPKGT